MESCELSVITPSLDYIPPYYLNDTLSLGSGTNTVDIYRLKSDEPLDPKSLSWDTKPTWGKKIATVHIGHNFSFAHKFACPMDSVHSFIFVASTQQPDAHVEWWQDKTTETPSKSIFHFTTSTVLTMFRLVVVKMNQYSTI